MSRNSPTHVSFFLVFSLAFLLGCPEDEGLPGEGETHAGVEKEVQAPGPKEPNEEAPPAAPLSILGFSPQEASFGATLTLVGENFSAVPSKNSVTLNGVPARVRLAKPDEIQVEVPKDMRATGLVRVSVAGQTAVSSAEFLYVPTVTVSTLAGSTPGLADGPGKFAQFREPHGIALDEAGNLYITDSGNHLIRRITPQGLVSTLAGSTQGDHEGLREQAQFNYPTGISMDADGLLYVVDSGNYRIRRVTVAGYVRSIAGDTQGFVDGYASYYWIGEARFNYPSGIAADAQGNLYVLDTQYYSGQIRQLSDGYVRTLEGEFVGRGSPLPASPTALAIDAQGNLYVGGGENSWPLGWSGLSKRSPDGIMSPIGSATPYEEPYFINPGGIAIDKDGNLYVTETRSHGRQGHVEVGERIRKVSPEGEVSHIAGQNVPIIAGGSDYNGGAGYLDGPGSVALFNEPRGIAVDASGTTLYVADTKNHRIRKIVIE